MRNMLFLVGLVFVGFALACGPAQAPQQPAQPVAPPSAAPPQAGAPQPATKPVVEQATPAAQSVKPAPRLVMGAPPAVSGYYVYTVALAKLLQQRISGLSVTVSEGPGAVANMKRLSEGGVDLAIGGFIGLYTAYAGVDPGFKEKPLKDARALWVMDSAAQVLVVREDSGITNIEQLEGKEINPGAQGGVTAVIMQQLAFPVLGIRPRWYMGGLADALGAMKDRRIVGLGRGTPLREPDAVIVEAMTAMKIRLLGWTPEQVQRVRKTYLFLSATQIPAGVYKAEWNEGPVTTWHDGIGMFTNAKLSEQLGYQSTKSAIEDSKASDGVQASAFKAMRAFDLVKLTLEVSAVPLHAGAQKYFQEIGATVPGHLRSPEAP